MTVWLLLISLLWGNCLAVPADQIPLINLPGVDVSVGVDVQEPSARKGEPQLHGRFLHITGMGASEDFRKTKRTIADLNAVPDFHPDPFYRIDSSPDEACHRGSGSAGIYGAERTDCDSPFTLINATFDWIGQKLKDSIDFIVWTGDSARHDSDDNIPRTKDEIFDLNQMLVDKFAELFTSDAQDRQKPFSIPIIPTFGNNDIMPHNIMESGPSVWTKRFADIWRRFIPEEQRHSFEHGGWFFVEVIPNQLAVFSLNTMYFFDSNSAVDGCSEKSQPGYEHMEWLRVQLQFLRDRGMKAILTGHVPPARTDNKQSWDETCWQKYALWMQQYRDVVVGSIYGHMNIEHFMFQDFKQIKKKTLKGKGMRTERSKAPLGDRLTTQKKSEYLTDLRIDWSEIPMPPSSQSSSDSCESQHMFGVESDLGQEKNSKRDKYLKEIGGPWGESYALTLVTASVVPNYFPTMRVIEYNTTGIDTKASTAAIQDSQWELSHNERTRTEGSSYCDNVKLEQAASSRKKHKKKKGHKKRKFTIPEGPPKTAPPGPAYSPQTFSWLGYTQYLANLTKINNRQQALEPSDRSSSSGSSDTFHEQTRKDHLPKFEYEVEYDTRNDTSVWCLPDLTVRNFLDLARLIGRYVPPSSDTLLPPQQRQQLLDTDESHKENDDCSKHHDIEAHENEIEAGEEGESETISTTKKKHKKKHEGRKKRDANRAWFTFVRRAFVGAIDDDDLKEEFEIS